MLYHRHRNGINTLQLFVNHCVPPSLVLRHMSVTSPITPQSSLEIFQILLSTIVQAFNRSLCDMIYFYSFSS